MRMLYIDGVEYTVDNNMATVTGYTEDICGDVCIPGVICDNIPVVGVADKAFCKCQYITAVTLPFSLKYIGANAFSWCNLLKKITLAGVRDIGERAFMGCARLSDIRFSSHLEAVYDKAFAYCTSLVAIRFPEGLEYMGESVFEGCRYLKYVYIPHNIDVIKNGTFYSCSSLCEVELPDSLRFVDEYSFAYCTSLTLPEIPMGAVINNNAFYECGAIKVGCIA